MYNKNSAYIWFLSCKATWYFKYKKFEISIANTYDKQNYQFLDTIA